MDGRQRDRKQGGVFYVIDASHADPVRDGNLQLEKGFHDVRGGEIVCTHDRVGTSLFHHPLNDRDVKSVDAADEMGLVLETGIEDRFAEARDPCIDRWGGSRPADEHWTLRSNRDQVLRDDIARAPVVDSNQVVLTPFRIGYKIAVEQNNGDAGTVKGFGDGPIDGVLFGGEFQWSEEYPGDFFGGKLAAKRLDIAGALA